MTDSTTVAQPIAQQLVQTLGVDLGDRKSSYCLVACSGEILDEGGVLTTKESLAALFQTMPSCRVGRQRSTASVTFLRLPAPLRRRKPEESD